jgi:dihydropyrimidine dehydrogenase (NADP+)
MGKGLSSEEGFTLESLRADGYKAVFLGIGLPDPKKIPMFQDLSEQHGYFTSKGFLPKVSAASKAGKNVLNVLIVC